MDNLTHSLTGVLLARAGFNRLTPRANWVMVLALNAPDIDLLWSWGREPHIYIDHHRGFTHSFFFMPLVALVPLALTRQFRWKSWIAAMVGVCVHILQDTTNVYGIRSLWPLTGHWFRLDWVSVVDPWIWALLLVGVLWPLLSGLVSGEIGSKRSDGSVWARAVLTMLLFYVAGRGVLHGRAVDLISARSYAGRPARTASAFPSALNLLSWMGVAETAGDWRVLEVDLAGELYPDKARVFPKVAPVKAASATEPFRAFLNFSQFPVWSTVDAPNSSGAQEVEVCDLRFGFPGEGRFCAVATVDQSGKVTAPHFQMGRPGSTVQTMFPSEDGPETQR
jgi:inner membrane protein